MLREQIEDLKGKITGQRVIKVEPPTVETSVSCSGTLTGEGIGTISSSGATKWRGSLFFSTASRGKLAFLNNMIGVFEGEFDAHGNFTNKSWEWK
jgi:hypothetical protein